MAKIEKVILNTSTKIKGRGIVLAGVEVDVTEAQKKDLEKKGFLGGIKKDKSPTNDKEVEALVKKVEELEAKVKDGGDSEALNKEIETLKADAEAKDEEIETLKADLEKARKAPAEK